MTIRFCPDCGAECGSQDPECRECNFPLHFQLISQSGDLKIQKAQMDRWHRIAQILRRNGIKIETRAAKYPARYQLWWALPGLGAIFFLLTVVFGGKMVDQIWPPTVASAKILDLNQVAANPENRATNQDSSQADASLGDVDTSFLKAALESSAEQKLITQDLNIDPQDFFDQPILPREQIETLASKALLNMTIGDFHYRATLLNGDGLLIVDQFSLNGAFQRETRTVNSGGVFRQEVVFVVPKVGFLNSPAQSAEKIIESDGLGVALLRAPIGAPLPYTINFNRDLAIGDTVYVAALERGDFVLEERQVVSPFQNPINVSLWSLDRSVDPQGAGAPVFSQQGELIGIHLFVNGKESVLSMLRLRERAPLIYREILD